MPTPPLVAVGASLPCGALKSTSIHPPEARPRPAVGAPRPGRSTQLRLATFSVASRQPVDRTQRQSQRLVRSEVDVTPEIIRNL